MLHLMRALESTLRSIGTSLKGFTYISANPTATMGQISTELKKYADSLPRKTARDLDFKDKLHAAAMHFKDITNAIRNKTAHTGKFYSSEQAHFILVATEQFLNDLVDIVKIPRRRK